MNLKSVGKCWLALLFGYCFSSSGLLFAQELHFRPLTDRASIPASECYNIIQDRDGFVWFATEAGYCRYRRDGIDIFDATNGIPERAVYASGLDEKGVLYVITSELRLLYFDGQKFVESVFSKKYKAASGTEWTFPSALKFSGDKIFIYEISRTCIINRANGQISFYQAADNTIHCNIQSPNEVFFESHRGIAYSGSMDKMVFEFPNHRRYECNAEFVGNSTPAYVVSFRKYTAVAFLQSLWVFDDGKLMGHKKFNSRILSIEYDADGNLLLGFLNDGLYRYEGSDLSKTPLLSLRNLSVSGILSASDNSIWCTTLESGVYFCTNPHVTSYGNNPGLDGKINLLTLFDKKLLAASSIHGIYQVNSNSAKLFLSFDKPRKVNNVVKFRDHFIVATEHSELVSIKTGKREMYWNSIAYLTAYNAFPFSDQCVFIESNSVVKFNPLSLSHPISNPREGFAGSRAKNALQLNDSVILIYGKRFLILYDGKNDRFVKKISNDLNLNSAVLCMDGNVYLTAKDKGVYQYHVKSGNLSKVFSSPPDRILFCIDQDAKGRYWIGTNTGVLLLNNMWRNVRDYSKLAALPETEIMSIKYYHDTVYVGSHDGLFSIPISYFPFAEKPKSPKLSYFLNNKTKYLSAEPEGWFGDVTVKLLIPELSEKVSAFYRISDGTFSSPIRIDGEQMTFSQLSPGKYHVIVVTQDRYGQFSDPFHFTFRIAPHFYQTVWFRLVVVTAFLILVAVIAVYIIKLVKRREEKKTEINTQLAEFQMSALQAQMNPHFIFNAINTIQSYILTRNKDEAYRYLNKFSNLIRLVLYHSQEKLITLYEELQVIQTYLELEHARFSSFEYEISVSEDIDIHEVQIPPMVIQPHLENAIWHGLNNLTTRKGKLTLSFSLGDDHLLIVVEDNGIGREEAAKHRKTRHKSMGLNLTEKRLEMLRTLFEEGDAVVEVFDKTDGDEASGTVVFIRIPLL